MNHIQPDLFGDYDAAQERAALWQRPATCPSCETTEPSGYLLSNNHGYDPETMQISGWPRFQHPNYGAMCTAQFLTRNHIIYAARHASADSGRDELDREMARGRALGLDVDAILAAVVADT